MNGKCATCGKEGLLHKHHVCYIPELVIALCPDCHYKAHKDKHNLLYPGKKASNGFYNSDNRPFIRISEETRTKLKELGNKGQTYDDVIVMLVREFLEVRK